MAHSVKDELDYLIRAAQAASKNDWTDSLVRTMVRAKAVIISLENRVEGKLTARDQIALAMLPGTAGISDPGEAMGAGATVGAVRKSRPSQ